MEPESESIPSNIHSSGNTDLLEETLLVMKQAQELAHFGNWFWDIQNNKVTWSDSLFKIYGLDKQSFKATFEGYQEMLFPDDRERILKTIQDAVANCKDTVFEERIVRPGGEIRYLRSWGSVKTDSEGRPVKMIGACLDITENKLAEEELTKSRNDLKALVEEQSRYIKTIETQNNRLKEIAFVQSHVVRAPLARIMSLVDLLTKHDNSPSEQAELLEFIASSAKEFDSVIVNIVDKSNSNEPIN